MAAVLPDGNAEVTPSTSRARFDRFGDKRLESAYVWPSACSFVCGDRRYFDFVGKICFGTSLFSGRDLSHLKQYCSGFSINERTLDTRETAEVGMEAALA